MPRWSSRYLNSLQGGFRSTLMLFQSHSTCTALISCTMSFFYEGSEVFRQSVQGFHSFQYENGTQRSIAARPCRASSVLFPE